MTDENLRVRRRNLPHWTMPGSVYFVTFRLNQGTLEVEERQMVLDHLKAGNHQFYDLAAAIVMEDHVHLLLRPIEPFDLSRIMKGIKGVSSRRINQRRGERGVLWQDESWDRIVRDHQEFLAKLQYMADNPVKAGLVRQIEEYPFWYCDPECRGGW